jgi:bifunctional non-homologous end joining protein LigD
MRCADRREGFVIRRLLKLFGKTVMVTHPDHRIHGDEGATKTELVEYYLKVAPRLLPFLHNRPISTVWLPDESTQEFRFARTSPPGCLGRFPMHRLPGLSGRQVDPYLTVPDADTLAALVNGGCLSFHPWSSTVAAPLHADRVVFNLDREAIAFREVRNAALLLRELLAACGLSAWVKTSGGQGLHVLVPVSGGMSFEDARLIAETIVTRAIRREPTLFSRQMRRARRRGRILIDISPNAYGATVIAPYAVATSGLVSALLHWDELRGPMYPEDFDMARVVAREELDLRNQRSFFAAEQSVDSLLKSGRGRCPTRSPRREVNEEWLLGDAPSALWRQANHCSRKTGGYGTPSGRRARPSALRELRVLPLT